MFVCVSIFMTSAKSFMYNLKTAKNLTDCKLLWFKWNLNSYSMWYKYPYAWSPYFPDQDCNFFYQFQKLIWINEQNYCDILLTVMPDQSICCKNHIFWIEKIQIIMACAMSCSAAAFHFTKVPFTYHIYRKKYKKIPTCSFYHCPTKYSK